MAVQSNIVYPPPVLRGFYLCVSAAADKRYSLCINTILGGRIVAHYLRDERVTNLSINADNLKQLSAVFAERVDTINSKVPENDDTGKKAFLTYIIRFDNKGYRVFSLEELLRYFGLAKEVERILITLENGESLRSNRQVGTFLELRLDEKDMNTCNITVTSDDKDWVDASFSAVQDVLVKCKNRNGWARSAWTHFGVQIIGVTLGFILSLWAAAKIAPRLAIENSFILAFLFVLLMFSNTWTYLNQRVLSGLNYVFPNIKFYRPDKERLHWLLQAIVGGVVFAIVMYILGQAFTFLIDVLSSLVRKNA